MTDAEFPLPSKFPFRSPKREPAVSASSRHATFFALPGNFGIPSENFDAVDGISYSAFLRRLWRHKLIFLLVVVLGTGGSAAVILRLPAHYVAHAYITIGDPEAKARLTFGPASGPVGSSLPDSGTVKTEVEILKSPQLAAKVISDLKLQDNPELNPQAQRSGDNFLARAKAALFGTDGNATTPADPAAGISRIIDRFLDHLRVNNKEGSRMIDVAFESTNGDFAQHVVNALADHYLNNQLELRSQSAQRTSAWLHERVTQLQSKVEEAEKKVENFRAQAGLFSTPIGSVVSTPGGSPLLLKQMTDLTAELATAKSARAVLESRLAQLRAAMQPHKGVAPSTAIVDSPFMRTLDAEEADAEQRLAEASATQGPRHPITIGLAQRLQHVRSAMRNEVTRVAASLENDLKIAQMKEDDLNNRINQLRKEIAVMNSREITLRGLEREAQADRLVLTNFISRFKEMSEESDMSSQRPDAQIVSYAQLPTDPDRPKKGLLILIAGMVSLVGAAIAAQLAEKADRSLRSLEDIESVLDIVPLGMVPIAREAQLSPTDAARYGSTYREALKSIHSRLFWSTEAPQVAMVTSAFGGEGKTTLVLGLVSLASQSGQRILLVDADFWKRGASRALGISQAPGLAEVLEGKQPFADTVISDIGTGCDVLLPGKFSKASLHAWVGRFPKLLETLRDRYDLILIDAPPLLSVSEVSLLAPCVDATVLAIRWGKTARDAVRIAAKRVREGGGTLAGAVLTSVQERENSRYGYGHPSYLGYAGNAYRSGTGAVTWTAGESDESILEEFPPGQQRLKKRFAAAGTRLATGGVLPGLSRQAITATTQSAKRSYQAIQQAAGYIKGQRRISYFPPEEAAKNPSLAELESTARHALLVLNVQEGITSGDHWYSPPQAASSRLIDTINRVCFAASACRIPVIYSSLRPDIVTARLLSPLSFGSEANDEQTHADQRLHLVSDNFINTVTGDAFSNPAFDALLRKAGVKHLFLAGLDGCTSVARTARSALARGYRVTFIRNAIFTVSERKWNRLLHSFEKAAAFAITSEEFADTAAAIDLRSAEARNAKPPVEPIHRH